MTDNTNYGIKENALSVFCVCQYHCHVSKRAENTDSARECQRYYAPEPSHTGMEIHTESKAKSNEHNDSTG